MNEGHPMTTATTTPTASDTPSTALEVARAEAERITAARAETEQRLATVRAESERIARQMAEAEAEAKRIAEAESRAHQAAVDAERKIAPDPIDADTARAIGESLVQAFDTYAADRNDQTLRDLYREIDGATARTLTSEISDDGRPIILAVIGLLDACTEWEMFRGLTDEVIENRRRMLDLGKTADPRLDIAPTDCELVRILLSELRGCLTGKAERQRPPESIGELLGQNVSPQQIARMLGFLKADGSGDIAGLGFVIDRALGAAGYFREVAGVAHLSRIGALNAGQAWFMFARDLETRRERAWSRGQAGSIQSAGEFRATRAGRPLADRPSATIDGDDPTTTPAFRADLAKIARNRAEARAAARAAADHDDSPMDRF